MVKMKKKTVIILVLSLFVVLLSSCGGNSLTIEEYEWHLKTAMRIDDSQLSVIATGELDEAHPEAKIVDVTLKAANGRLTVTDKTNKKEYTGTYKVNGKTPEGTEYKVIINGVEGHAGVAMTTYHDGTEQPTLPINLGSYSLYFYA